MNTECLLWKALVMNPSGRKAQAKIEEFGATKMVVHCMQCLVCDALNKKIACDGSGHNVKLAIRFLVQASEAEEERVDEYLGASVDVIVPLEAVIPDRNPCMLLKRFEVRPHDPAILRAVKSYSANRLLEHSRDCRPCMMRFLRRANGGKPLGCYIILSQLAEDEDAKKQSY